MRLLIVQDYLRVGGTERQTLFLARRFQESGDEVQLLVFRPGGHIATDGNVAGLKLHCLQTFDSFLPLWAPGLMKTIKKMDPEIILCMGRTANCYAGFIQKRFPAIPVVGTLRTGKSLFPLHHWSLGVVRAVMVNSNWWKRRLLERDFPEKRIHVVHNAVLLERSDKELAQERQKIRQAYNLEENTCLFLNVSTFRPGKRHVDMLKIMLRLKEELPDLDWRLWLVGDGREYNRCKRWAAAKGLGTRIRFFHYQKDPFPFYAAADVAISTSREDSLPNFLIEAQACQLPVVAYDCRGVSETCLPGVTGDIIKAGDETAFLDALQKLARQPMRRKEYRSHTKAFVKDRFSPAPQADKIRKFFENLR